MQIFWGVAGQVCNHSTNVKGHIFRHFDRIDRRLGSCCGILFDKKGKCSINRNSVSLLFFKKTQTQVSIEPLSVPVRFLLLGVEIKES